MYKFIYLFILLSLGLCLSASAFAQTPVCDALSGKTAEIAQTALKSNYLYDCCDENISDCLTSQPECKLASLLANEVCRLAGEGKTAEEIKRVLEFRAMAMSDITPASKIDLLPEHVWGNPNAKTVLSIYLCGRCQYCSKHVPKLIEALETSQLKNKVAVNMRLFPIKAHPGSTPAALAVEAAAKQGKAWDLLVYGYRHFDEFSEDKLPLWAKEVGIDLTQFTPLTNDPNTRNAVVASKKEGLANDVNSTPTFFINGRKYQGTFDVQTMLSMLEEAVNQAN